MQLSHQEQCCYMIGQGASQTASSTAQPSPTQATNGVNFNSLAYNPFDAFLPSSIPASANVGDHRRPPVKAPHPTEVLKCPRCESLDTKFCYYNNYSLTQPRYFCKNCKRYWTAGGALRNVPVGGGLRKNKRSKLKLAAAAAAAAAGVVDGEAALAGQQSATHGMPPQSSQSKSVGDVTNNSLEQRSASGAMPSNVVVGVPEISHMYSLPSGDVYAMKSQDIDNLISSASHCNADHMADQNGAHAPSALLHPQAGNLYAKDEANAGVPFFCDTNQLPQFYPSYAGCMSMPFGTAVVPNGSVPGYAANYNFFTADPIRQISNEEDDSAVVGGMSDIGSSAREVKQESGPAQGPVNTYEWQLISEGLFNSASTSPGNCSYTPSSSWPDFSQFNDSRSG